MRQTHDIAASSATARRCRRLVTDLSLRSYPLPKLPDRKTPQLAYIDDVFSYSVHCAIAIALPTSTDLLWLAAGETCRAVAQRFYFTATSYSSGSAVPSGASDGTEAAAPH
eukprot:COSAG06_NODE_5589_length_3379_cov_115.159451_2_plen_111_part_00